MLQNGTIPPVTQSTLVSPDTDAGKTSDRTESYPYVCAIPQTRDVFYYTLLCSEKLWHWAQTQRILAKEVSE